LFYLLCFNECVHLTPMFGFCTPIRDKKRFLPKRKLGEDVSFTLFEKAQLVAVTDWNQLVQADDFFFQLNYLQLTESCYPSKLAVRYVIVYDNNVPCGILYFQIIDFQASVFGELLNDEVGEITSKRIKLFERYIDKNKSDVLMRLFTCGNNLISGKYGFKFLSSISESKATEIVLALTDVIAKEEKLRGTISATLIKDFESPLEPSELLEEQKYTGFSVEPNMEAHIPKGVTTLSEYLSLFSKKYRNRAKGIFKAAESITIKELTADELKTQQVNIYALYENIYKRAKFKLLKLPPTYFEQCKRFFPNHFFVYGFYNNGELVAFSSGFTMHGMVEAHYIGLNYEANKTYELYQNILYKFIEKAAIEGLTKVNFGRTAAEIKSTVGAVPQHLMCYIRPQNTVSRMIQKPFIRFLQPQEWIQRNPFKEE
jgi:hypothetical protein